MRHLERLYVQPFRTESREELILAKMEVSSEDLLDYGVLYD